ncbi:hypothetical protein KAW18_15985 [candidate division WOR-3 bacterium]|nr:hypothetical protein [candidate division WOR-3 bacterium]
MQSRLAENVYPNNTRIIKQSICGNARKGINGQQIGVTYIIITSGVLNVLAVHTPSRIFDNMRSIKEDRVYLGNTHIWEPFTNGHVNKGTSGRRRGKVFAIHLTKKDRGVLIAEGGVSS